MSGLTKKTVVADRTLATILGVQEGELVSYAQLSKGLHQYIKANDLKSPQPIKPSAGPAPPTDASHVTITSAAEQTSLPVQMKTCKDCNGEIPAEAVFCDLCGVSQE